MNFVKYVIRQLGLANAHARHIRAEDLAGEVDPFDVVLSRAVSSVQQLRRLAFPLLAKEGMLMAMKGRGVAAELDEGAEIADYLLPGLQIRRFLVMLRP